MAPMGPSPLFASPGEATSNPPLRGWYLIERNNIKKARRDLIDAPLHITIKDPYMCPISHPSLCRVSRFTPAKVFDLLAPHTRLRDVYCIEQNGHMVLSQRSMLLETLGSKFVLNITEIERRNPTFTVFGVLFGSLSSAFCTSLA